MSSNKVESLVKLRDAFSMASQALHEYILTLAPTELQENKTELPCSKSLKDLPWRSYNNTKEPAAQDEGGWIFADTKGAEALLATLMTKDKAQIDGFEYRLSGKKFISRKPLKPK